MEEVAREISDGVIIIVASAPRLATVLRVCCVFAYKTNFYRYLRLFCWCFSIPINESIVSNMPQQHPTRRNAASIGE